MNTTYGLQAGGNTRFLGRIYSMEDRYDEGGMGAVTVVTLTDGMADMSVHTAQLGAARAAELTSTRFPFLYDGVEAPFSADSDTGIYTVEAGDLPQNRLTEGRALAAAEGGAIYAGHGSHGGQVVFRNANWLITSPRAATTQAVLGTGRIGIAAATTKYSISRVFNDINYENSSITANATDATSVDEYSKRTLSKTVLNNDNTDLQAIADRDLALLKDLQFSIDSVTINPENIFEVLFALQVAVGDRLEVTMDVNEFEYTQTLFVAGVAESWNAASNDWTLTLRLDSREGDTVLT